MCIRDSSEHGFACASGTLATLYGRGARECSWLDGPSFATVADLLDDRGGFAKLLAAFPTTLNAVNPFSGESALQFAVRTKPQPTVDALLGAGARFGLLADRDGATALAVAIAREKKECVRALLRASLRTAREQPLALRPFLRHRAAIATKYPDIFLAFLRETPMLRVTPELVPAGQSIALPSVDA